MIALTAKEIATVVQGKLFASEDLLVTAGPVIDSRDAEPGCIFVALKGENSDGHDFAQAGIDKGAVLVLATRKVSVPCIVVDDAVEALAKLAKHVRDLLPNLMVVAITGSFGKTTAKDLIAWILGMHGETIAPRNSFNNELGLPLTLLRCTENTKFCILEMGARKVGDIAALTKIAAPHIGVVLVVGNSHIGEFGSIEAIARTKAELIHELAPGSVAVLGQYDSFTPLMANGCDLEVIFFGETHNAQVRAADIEVREGRAHFDLVTPQGREPVGLRLIGVHQIPNALAAAAVATALNIPIDVIAGALSTAEVSSKWRMQIEELPGLVLINDAYNANLASTAGALQSLVLFAQERGGRSWAFLGKMHELGESSRQDHASIGTLARELGIDHLVCVGAPEYGQGLTQTQDFGDEMTVHYCPSQSDALALAAHLENGDVVLVKASRAEKLEELALNIADNWRKRKADEEVSEI